MNTDSVDCAVQHETIAPKQLSLEEQIGDLRIVIRNLRRRIEMLEAHSHGFDGMPVVRITKIGLP